MDIDSVHTNYGTPLEKSDDIWLISYADLVTNLLIFFVILVSASKISSIKFEKIQESLKGKVDGAGGEQGYSIEKIHDEVVKKIDEKQIHDQVEVIQDDESVAIILKDQLLFDLGEYQIRSENLPKLVDIITTFRGLPQYARISIEGYTDDNPVNQAAYRSNWHLSVLRALSVLEEFEKLELCQSNCELKGFGEFNPVVPNRDTKGNPIEKNQSQNRRVVVRIF